MYHSDKPKYVNANTHASIFNVVLYVYLGHLMFISCREPPFMILRCMTVYYYITEIQHYKVQQYGIYLTIVGHEYVMLFVNSEVGIELLKV